MWDPVKDPELRGSYLHQESKTCRVNEILITKLACLLSCLVRRLNRFGPVALALRVGHSLLFH